MRSNVVQHFYLQETDVIEDEGPVVPDIDAFNDLTVNDVREVIESVAKEMLGGLQVLINNPSFLEFC